MEVSLAAADVLQITAVAFELPPSSWCGTLKRLGTRPRWSPQPSAPDAVVQLEEYDSRLPGTDRPARTPPAPNQGCHRREAPARGPRCSVSRPGPGSRQLGEPARTYDRRSFPTRTPAARAGSVGKPAVRRQVKPPQLDSNGVPSSSTASTQPILPAVGLGRGHELPVETPTLPGPHSSCADSDWACHTGHPAPTTSDARICSRHGPQSTRPHAPAGHDRSGCTSLRPAGTFSAGQARPRARRPGYHVPPITPIRAAHNAFNAQPGRTPCL